MSVGSERPMHLGNDGVKRWKILVPESLIGDYTANIFLIFTLTTIKIYENTEIWEIIDILMLGNFYKETHRLSVNFQFDLNVVINILLE